MKQVTRERVRKKDKGGDRETKQKERDNRERARKGLVDRLIDGQIDRE